jgi:hypothetical protein
LKKYSAWTRDGRAGSVRAVDALDSLQTLGEDLLLLAIHPQHGLIMAVQRLDSGLAGSELVRLTAGQRVDIVGNRIVVLDTTPTGDAELDTALASIARSRRTPRMRMWIRRRRRGVRSRYLARLIAAGAIARGRRRPLERPRWLITDPVRLAEVRGRLDTIACFDGVPDTADAAFGGLVHAIQLDNDLYHGLGGRNQRKRLAQVGRAGATAINATVQAVAMISIQDFTTFPGARF